MKYRKMGKYGMKISEVSLGAWLTYGGSVEEEIATKCIHEALEQKINFIDVADVYARGKAEEVVGHALGEEQFARKDCVVSSKVFWPMSNNPNDVGLSRKHIFDSIESTLDRLGMDYIDIYFAHRFDYQTPVEETVAAMDDLISSGYVRYWGTSVWSAAQLERAMGVCKDIGAKPPAVEQPRYNMLDRHVELEVLNTTDYHGMGVVVWSPLAQGLLTGKYNDGQMPSESRAANENTAKFMKYEMIDENFKKIKQLGEIANELEVSLANLALAWCLRRKELTSVITGATKIEHVQKNVKATEIFLSNDTLNQIEGILQNTPKFHGSYNPVLVDR
ncbi:MAG: aldo/keto reductase family protein [Candidatus Hodarchaeales archaeon]|jgi:voltage-dependent potassium channel beta subunit